MTTAAYLRGVLTNNIDRARDIIWDLTNKPEFNKSDPNVLGVVAVAEQVLTSLTALLVDCDEAPAQEPVAWRWKPKTSTLWIYNPDVQWLFDHKDDPEIDCEPVYAAPASHATRGIIAWLDAEIEDAKQKQVAGFKLCTAQGALMGEKSHSRQCALFEVKQRLVAPIREDRVQAGAVSADDRDEPRTVTAEDREYASELLADLANGDEPRLEVAAQWFRKARVEHSLGSVTPPNRANSEGGQ